MTVHAIIRHEKKIGIDVNQIAAQIVEKTTTEPKEKPEKNPTALALGSLGGLKGGKPYRKEADRDSTESSLKKVVRKKRGQTLYVTASRIL